MYMCKTIGSTVYVYKYFFESKGQGNMTAAFDPERLFLNSSPPGQNGRHFADDIFKYIFTKERFCILIRISLKFATKGQIDNTAAFVQVMAWRRTVY